MDEHYGLEGLGIALATPFDAEGQVDYKGFAKLMGHLAGDGGKESGGTDFFVVLGSTGEGATVEPEERRQLISMSVAAYGSGSKGKRLPIVIGTGSNSTAQTVRLTAEAVSLGADAVLVVIPFYNKPTPDGLVAHYKAVAQAAAGKPVIVYNVPGRTGLNLTPQALARLWEIPGVVALKESSGNMAQIGEIARTLPAGKTLLSGDDAFALPSISLGAEGLISVAGNVYPRRVKALIEAGRSGQRRKAAAIHAALLPFMDALFVESNPIPLKAALAHAGICGDALRLPLVQASAAARARIHSTMDALEALSEGLE
jgi:4-hydroxy-tetrahydrodipicolinate synthase